MANQFHLKLKTEQKDNNNTIQSQAKTSQAEQSRKVKYLWSTLVNRKVVMEFAEDFPSFRY